MRNTPDVEKFVQCCCRFITHEERAKDIRDELTDHIYTNVEELEMQGLSTEEATNKALSQMGDPTKLSQEYKEPISIYSRMTTAAILFSLLVFYIGTEMYEVYQGNDSLIITVVFTGMIFLSYIPFVISLVSAHKRAKELKPSEPLFYIQVCSHKNIDGWIFKGIRYFLLTVILLLIGATVMDSLENGGSDFLSQFMSSLQPINIMWLLYYVTLNIWDCGRKPSVVYEEGVMTFLSFVLWEDMLGYRWQREYSKGEYHYTLQVKAKKKTFKEIIKGKGYLQLGIKVDTHQMDLISEVMNSHNVNYLQYM